MEKCHQNISQQTCMHDVLYHACTYIVRVLDCVCHPSTERSEEAVASYQRAVNLDPSLTVALTSLGRLYRQQGLTSSAEQTFLRCLSYSSSLREKPLFAVLLLHSGRCYEAEICAILFLLRCSFIWYHFLPRSKVSDFGQKPWTIIRRFDRN